MTTWTDEYTTMIDDCEKRESRLTEWERTFLDSIKAKLDIGHMLTERQRETLDAIWERVTAKG